MTDDTPQYAFVRIGEKATDASLSWLLTKWDIPAIYRDAGVMPVLLPMGMTEVSLSITILPVAPLTVKEGMGYRGHHIRPDGSLGMTPAKVTPITFEQLVQFQSDPAAFLRDGQLPLIPM